MPISGLDIIQVSAAGGVAFTAGLLALAAIAIADTILRPPKHSAAIRTGATFLFDGEELIDNSPEAEVVLQGSGAGTTDLARALSNLTVHFPALKDALTEAELVDELTLLSRDESKRLLLSKKSEHLRIEIMEADREHSTFELEPAVWAFTRDELETLRMVIDAVPFLVWRQNSEGEVYWANRAYLDALEMHFGARAADAWPPPPLFDPERLKSLAGTKELTRLRVEYGEALEEHWYDCFGIPSDTGPIYSALTADAVVEADQQRMEFTQTLTKAFSHLKTGLAVFDRERRLTLFNPSLTRLTELAPGFLAGRPSLFEFLDKLRDCRMIPEPRNYADWRARMAELEAQAESGTYSETWSLSNGQTYNVSGRPHPDGAVAFIFEDITQEMALTRRFRSDLEIGQGVLDALDEAVAVFGRDGALALSNAAYRDLWGSGATDADVGSRVTVTESMRIWMSGSQPTPLWGEIRDFVLHARDRQAWGGAFQLRTGGRHECRISPLRGGVTLIRFVPGPSRATSPPTSRAMA
ncbi:MAG: PAS-domain containing protein [Pseudomonadota bacterium]